MKIDELFDIEYPKTLAYSWLTPDENGINFVSAQEKDNGIVGRVQEESGIKVYSAGCITVPLKGSVLMAHLQPERCYVAHQIGVLIPKKEMSLTEKLFYVTCIRSHSYKYNYGRQADRTLGELEVPLAKDMMPDLHCTPLSTRNTATTISFDTNTWKAFFVGDLFDIINGKGITTEEIENYPGDLEAVQSGEGNNGVMGHIDKAYCCRKGYPYCEESCLTVARSGTSGFVSFHQNGCVVGDSAKILLLKEPRAKTIQVYLFMQTLLAANRFKYTYGRKVTEALYKETAVKLPVSSDGKPDWQWMENYIKSLPYGDRL